MWHILEGLNNVDKINILTGICVLEAIWFVTDETEWWRVSLTYSMHLHFLYDLAVDTWILNVKPQTKSFGGYIKKICANISTQSSSFASSLTCWWVSFWPHSVKTHMSWGLYVWVRCKQREKASVQIMLISHNAAVCIFFLSARSPAVWFFCFTFLLMHLMFFVCQLRSCVSTHIDFCQAFFF